MSSLPRTLENFLTSWEEYVYYMPAPTLFKRWAGLFLISTVLSRRCWLIADPTFPPLYANLFILLVGPPGCGKDIVINKVVRLLNTVKDSMDMGSGIRLSGRSVSAKGILDMMADEDSEFTFTGQVEGKRQTVKFHSVTACIPELGTFLPEYDTQLVSILNELYNCNEMFEEQIRGRGNQSVLKIPNPHLTMLLGTQPTTLSETFPEQAFRMGFFSRTNLIHSRDIFRKKLYDRERPDNEHLLNKLVSDLRSMASLQGRFKTTKSFEEAMNNFHINNPGKLTHSRFEDYNTRRSLHLHKLAMVVSISENNNKTLDLPHLERALEYLKEAEVEAPSVFSELVTSNGFAHSVEQVLSTASSSIITHQQLERTLRRTHKPYEVGMIIRSMVGAGDLVEMENKKGLPKYRITKTGKDHLND